MVSQTHTSGGELSMYILSPPLSPSLSLDHFCALPFVSSLSLSIAEGLRHKSLEHLGSPMIYELVEYAKDCLTDNNRPCGQCAICQFDFEVYMKPHPCSLVPRPRPAFRRFQYGKVGRAWYIFSHEHDLIGKCRKFTELTGCVSCIFNQLHAQCLVCTTGRQSDPDS